MSIRPSVNERASAKIRQASRRRDSGTLDDASSDTVRAGRQARMVKRDAIRAVSGERLPHPIVADCLPAALIAVRNAGLRDSLFLSSICLFFP
jgi:hypothetical protein